MPDATRAVVAGSGTDTTGSVSAATGSGEIRRATAAAREAAVVVMTI